MPTEPREGEMSTRKSAADDATTAQTRKHGL